VRSDICTQCCGTEREVTLDCPLDCEHLIESRKHEKPSEIQPGDVPHPDVRVTESFVESHGPLFQVAGSALLDGALSTSGAVDSDVREALESLIKTYKTLDSGLIYESRPSNPYAEAIRQRVSAAIQEFNERVYQQTGVHSVRDADWMRALVFFARVERTRNNGRRRGKAFLTILWDSHAPRNQPQPGEPGIIST